MQTEKLKQALSILEDAKAQVSEILTDNESSAILLRVNAGMNSGITALSHAAGSANTAFATAIESKPITNFMGKKIGKSPVTVTEDQITPEEHEKNIYKGKVEKLYSEILRIESTDVLKNYTIPEDVLVLRGVAKRAGVKEFDGELNVSFVDAIKDAIIEKEKIKKAQQDALNIGTDPIPAAKEEKAEQRITRINEAKSFDEVTALVEGEDRKTVLDAAEKKIADFEWE